MLFNSKKHLSKIAELEAELATFYDAEQDLRQEMIYLSLDDTGKITDAGNLFTRSLGYTAHDIVGMKINDIIVEKSLKKEHTQLMLNAIKNQKHWHGALQLKSKNTTEV